MTTKESIKNNNEQCTGCTACVNICPNNAIKLSNDENGFYKAFVDNTKCTNCGLCSKTCPLNGIASHNNPKPKLCVFKNEDKDAKLSATAGGFQIIAKNFIKNGGKVVGAAWSENWQCKHIMTDNLEDLKKIYKSKYVQSYMSENLLKEIRKELDNNVKILFSGVPCQIAGLYNFLSKEYDNLYVVDILCNNAPSPKHFERFLDEKYGIENVADVDFRYKDNDFSTSKMILKITTKDGKSTYDEVWRNGSYYEAFVRRMLLGKHCESCKFAKFPRLGDITLGDMYGAEQINAKYTPLNTESVMINSKKGEALFDLIKSSASDISEIPLNYIVAMHHVLDYPIWEAHPNRNRLFDLIKKMPFEKACSYAINDRYDIGLVGVITNENYGGGLTNYALKCVLEDLGKTVLLILPPETNLAWLPRDVVNYIENPYKDYELPHYPDKISMRDLNLKCDIFLTGSDQLYSTHFYNYGIMSDLGEFALLDWVWDSKKKAAYSASFGSDSIVCPEDMKNRMKYYLSKFDNFSCRERSGVEICKKELNINSEFVLDPVFLCDKRHYDKLISKSNKNKKGVAAYILDTSYAKDKIIGKIADKYNLDTNYLYDFKAKRDIFTEDWLKIYSEADFIVTDSYHGTCFAIIFNKPFITFANKTRGFDRFKILEEFGLQDKLVFSYEDFENRKEEILSPIDWNDVNIQVEKLKEKSFKILKDAISKEEKPLTNDEMLSEKMHFMINEYKSKIETLSNNYNARINYLTYDFNNKITALNLKLRKNTLKGKLMSLFIELPSELIAHYKLNKLLNKNKNKKIVFWGASIFLNNFIKKYNINYKNIVAVVDSDIYKSGQKIGKYNVVTPDNLKNMSFECFISTIKNNNKTVYPKIEQIVKKDFKDKVLLENIF